MSKSVVKGYDKPEYRQSDTGETQKVIIDDERQDLFGWARNIVTEAEHSRDLLRITTGTGYVSMDFVEVMKESYRYYRFLEQQLSAEGFLPSFTSGYRNEHLIDNSLAQKMRIKLGMLLSSIMAWEYESYGETGQDDFIYALNQILAQRLEEDGYRTAYVRSRLRQICYGSSIVAYMHTKTINYPHGGQAFTSLDPLQVGWEHGSCAINSKSIEDRSKYIVLVLMRPKGVIEREWGVKVDESPGIADPSKWSMPVAIGGANALQFLTHRMPEVYIWYDDDTMVYDREVIQETEPALDSKGQQIFDNDRRLVTKPMIRDGEPVTKEVRTRNKVLKNPNRLLCVYAGNTLCYFGSNPLSHGKVPLVKYDNVPDPDGFWGISDIELGKSSQRAKTIMDDRMYSNVKNTPSIMVLNETAISDRDNPITEDHGYYVLRVKNQKFDNAIDIKHPHLFSQDQVLFIRDQEIAMQRQIGIPDVSAGMAKAADSAIKDRTLDNFAQRIHRPIEESENEATRQLGIMWLAYMRAYDRFARSYKVVGLDGTPRREEFMGMAMDEDYPLKVSLDVMHGSLRESMLADLIEIKGVAPSLPDDLIFLYSGIPELANRARATRQNRERVTRMIQLMDQAGIDIEGMLEELITRQETK